MAGSTAPRVALLRGINVGGRGMVKMSRLIEVLTSHGYLDVITHLQSCNVIFSEP